MKTNNQGINLIKYGELHTYYPVKFDTSLTFEKLCEAISNSSIIFKDEYQEKITNALGASLAQRTKEFNANASSDCGVYMKMENFDQYESLCTEHFDFSSQEILLELDATDSSLKLSFLSVELEILKNRIKRLEEEYDYSARYYGSYFVNSHERFLLLPLKIELNNKEVVWLSSLLYVFSNGMGVLKLELPLINVDPKPLMQNDKDQFIGKAMCSWNNNFVNENSLNSISNFYINTLFNDTKINQLKYNDAFHHIIFVDIDTIPRQINNLPNAFQEDLFRIISAPVPERPCTSFLKDAQDYLKENSWGGHNMKYIIKTTGGCLSFIDQELLDYLDEEHKKANGVNSLDKADYFYMSNNLARDLQINAELALLIIILKKLNNKSTIIQKTNPTLLSEKQDKYWENIQFICNLQEDCYGTVSEQITAFERMMSHYLKPEITHEKLTAINNVLKAKQQEKDNSFQKFIAVGSLLLVILFGLPSIYETLGIIRAFFVFVSEDIAYVSQNNSSIFLWLAMNIFILICLFKKK